MKLKYFLIFFVTAVASNATTLPVTVNTDAGAGSLRAQIAAAANGDTVAITTTGTITLTTGAIAITGKNLTITTGTTGANNLTVTTGATTRALNIVNAACTITGITFNNCKGLPGDVDTGGAIAVDNFTAGGGTNVTTITDCAFANNQSGWGGAVDIFNGGLVMTRCTFTGNTCTGLAFGTLGGGGALSLGPTVASTITNCTFSANVLTGTGAGVGGGAIYNYGSVASNPPPLALEHCTFAGNVDAAGSAGAIKGNFTGSYKTLENVQSSLLVGNQAPGGTLLNFSTVTTGTTAKTYVSKGGNVTDENTSSSKFMTASHDLVNNAAVAASVIALATNGGSTKTHAIVHGSPAQGNSTASALAIDQRGAARHPAADSGAFELIEPELNVKVSGVNVVYNGSVGFGATIVGTSVTKTVTVTNAQTSPFVSGPLIVSGLSLPTGYSNSGFSTASLPGGQSATFNITLPAGLVGSYKGLMTLLSNDGYNPDINPADPASENPFVLNLAGAVNSPGGPIEQWRQLYFGPGITNTGSAADGSNPTGDGIPNLLKYALNLDPTVAYPPGSQIATSIGSDGFLRMTVTKNPAATDVSLAIQVTGNLTDPASWSAAGTTIDQNTATILQAHDNTPISAAPSRFIRLNVTRQ